MNKILEKPLNQGESQLSAPQNNNFYADQYVIALCKTPAKKKAFFWIIAFALSLAILFLFSSLLLPFVVGFVLAYFLNPVVELLGKMGVSRLWSTLLITLFILLLLVMLLTIFVPIICSQLQEFVTKGLPLYLRGIQQTISQHNLDWIRDYLGSDPSEFQTNLQAVLSYAADFLKSLLNSLLNSGKSLMSIISLFVIAPVVAFYLLLDWEKLIKTIDSWIPRNNVKTIRGIFYEMDRAVAGFIRGQGATSLLLGLYYAITLTICGLNYSLLLGLLIGFLSFIPYIGTMSGFLAAMGIAWVQYYQTDWIWILVILGVFLVGQFLEGYILQPKLVGSSVGLHPVWLMFALFAFSSLFGVTGMLIAVPTAAALGVLSRFALHCYLDSHFYKGSMEQREHGQ